MANTLRGRMPTFVVLLAVAVVFALGGTPLAVVADETMPVSRSAHLHRGTCETFDLDAAYPLADLTTPAPATPTPDAVAIPAMMSLTTLDVPLADLLAGTYVINVHESAEKISDYVACGAISGAPGPNGLAIGLAPHDPHGEFSGVAWLHPDGNRTVVAVFLTEEITVAGEAPLAPPFTVVPEEVGITLAGPAGEFTIGAEQTTFRVGVPYRFVVTNAGQLPHELMVIPPMPGGQMLMEEAHHMALALLEEEDLPPGATQTLDVTFDTPAPAGTLELACHVPGHYEAGMYFPIEVIL